jgi:hypothetical protein
VHKRELNDGTATSKASTTRRKEQIIMAADPSTVGDPF